MVVGYAAFQTQLKVTGTSKVTSNWDIEITNVTSGTPTGSAENTVAPSWDKLWASMEADLYDKGDAMEYDVTIENKGTLDAKLNDIITNMQNSNSDAVIITFSGYTKGEILKSGNTKVVHVKIEYNPEYEGGETSSEVKINFDYTQNNNEENNPDSQYLLTYDYSTNGGNGVERTEEYFGSGSKVDLSNKATKEGWTFVGWNTDKDAETGLKSYQMPVGNTTLYAIYSKALKVTYEQGENITSIGKTNDSCNIYNNQTSCEVTLPEITATDGYISDGWYSGEEKIGDSNEKYTIKEDTTLTSKAIEDIIELSISTTSTTNSITVVANATSPSGIVKYEYSKDGGNNWIEGTSNTYTFTGLTSSTSYNIMVRVTNNSGKVLEKEIGIDITDNVVIAGDGLYEDEYEDGRYIYRGTNPNNYIWFNNEMWRIISKNSDGTYKIIRNESTENMAFNSENSSDWEISDIKAYLNGDYLATITTNQDKIVSHTWSIGAISDNSDLAGQIADENRIQSQSASVGMITVSDYLRANSNIEQCGNRLLNNTNNEVCLMTNWIYNIVPSGRDLWTISPSDSNGIVFRVIGTGSLVGGVYGMNANVSSYCGASLVLYLSSNITLTGSGTESNPFQIDKGVSTSTLEKLTYTESGSNPKTVTITYPKGCGNSLTCSYQKDNGETVNVDSDAANVEFTDDGSLVATVTDGTNTASSSYTVTVVRTINDYTKDGLFAFYDGIENTPSGHGAPTDTWYNKALDLNPSVATTVRSTLNGFNTSSWTNDNGLLFDGVDDMVDTGYLQEVLGQKITLSFIAYTTDINNYRGYFGYHEGYEGSPVNHGFDMQFNNNQINFRYFGNSINCGLSISEETINNMILNKKTNITVILSAQDKIAVYFNGQKIEETSCTNVLEPYPENFIIGQSLPSPERYFKGTMYNFMVYKKALTEDEIKQNYKVDKARYNLE